MTGVSGPGVWPGTDPLEALLTIFGDLADTPEGVTGRPCLAHLPGRGAGAEPVARTAALLVELPVELGPHGWRLADHPGLDLGRARSFLRADLDALAVAAHGYTGPVSVQVVGPWTLAATLYLAHGDRVLTDYGAVRALADSLAAGIVEHLAAVRTQVPGAEVTVRLDEPLLGQVGAGVVPTFSGRSRIRAVRGHEIVEVLEPVVRAAGPGLVVQVGPVWDGIPPVVLSGAAAVGVELGPLSDEDGDPAAWNPAGWELLARAIERGTGLWAGLVPSVLAQQLAPGADVRGLADLVSVPWRRLGLPLAGLNNVVLAASGGAATWDAFRTPDQARAALRTLVRTAAVLAERASD